MDRNGPYSICLDSELKFWWIFWLLIWRVIWLKVLFSLSITRLKTKDVWVSVFEVQSLIFVCGWQVWEVVVIDWVLLRLVISSAYVCLIHLMCIVLRLMGLVLGWVWDLIGFIIGHVCLFTAVCWLLFWVTTIWTCASGLRKLLTLFWLCVELFYILFGLLP